MRTLNTLLTALLLLLSTGNIFSDDILVKVVASVGEEPITSIDLKDAKESFDKRTNIRKDHRAPESQILDMLISRAIVQQTAQTEMISISEKQIDDLIKREMENNKIEDQKQFEALIKKNTGFTIPQYREEMRKQLTIQQIMYLKIPLSKPGEDEVNAWFKKNKSKMPNKFLIRIIQRKYNKANVKEELKVNKLMNEAELLAKKNFAAAAKKYSDHPSKNSGGSLGWVTLEDLLAIDRILTNYVYSTKGKKGLSRVFVGEGRYWLVRVDGTKRLTLDDVRSRVEQIVAMEQRQKAFDKWIKEQRKALAVKIYLDNYQEL